MCDNCLPISCGLCLQSSQDAFTAATLSKPRGKKTTLYCRDCQNPKCSDARCRTCLECRDPTCVSKGPLKRCKKREQHTLKKPPKTMEGKTRFKCAECKRRCSRVSCMRILPQHRIKKGDKKVTFPWTCKECLTLGTSPTKRSSRHCLNDKREF